MKRNLAYLAALSVVGLASAQFNQDCSNFNGENGCQGGQTTTNPPDWSLRSFQTFLPGDPYYKPEYEGLGRIMCYSAILYESDRTKAVVDVRCRQHSSIVDVKYKFGSAGL